MWQNPNDVLEYAIEREQEAHDFYADLAKRAKDAETRQVFEQLSRVELGHKVMLERIRAEGRALPAPGKVMDLKLADYLVDVTPTPNMPYADILILAMKREKAAFRLYTDLAKVVGGELAATFQALAQEEAHHKLRFEVEYDERFMTEN